MISRSEWGACLFIGLTELLAAFLLKFVPSKWLEFLPDISDFEDTAHQDPVTDLYDQATSIKVTDFGADKEKPTEEGEGEVEMTGDDNNYQQDKTEQ